MTAKIAAAAAILSLTLAPGLLAQGRGGQAGARQDRQQPAATSQQRGGQQQQKGQQTAIRDQKRQRIHATEQQRDQYRTCTQSAERVRTQARDMTQAVKGGGFNNDTFRQEHQRLREEVRLMQQEQDRFQQGLSDEQRLQMQDRIRKTDRARERVHTQLQAMDQELKGANPDGNRLSKQAREMEQAMKEWQKQYRRMGSDMDIEP